MLTHSGIIIEKKDGQYFLSHQVGELPHTAIRFYAVGTAALYADIFLCPKR